MTVKLTILKGSKMAFAVRLVVGGSGEKRLMIEFGLLSLTRSSSSKHKAHAPL